MPKTIIQEVVFENTTPKELYDLYMNTEKHSHVTGGPVTMNNKEGSEFSAHGGYITGKFLQLVDDKLIVQSWRAQGWDPQDVDSTFIIHLRQDGKNVVLTMTHANIPDQHVANVEKGWYDHYWNPWKQHLAGEPITRPQM